MKVGIILTFVILCAIMSYVTIWSLNTLFPVLAIPYTFDTIVAGIILILLIDPVSSKAGE